MTNAAPVDREAQSAPDVWKQRTKELSIALMSLTPGGSEYIKRDGNDFFADVTACMAFIEKYRHAEFGLPTPIPGWKESAALSLVNKAAAEVRVHGFVTGATTEAMKKLSRASEPGELR